MRMYADILMFHRDSLENKLLKYADEKFVTSGKS
jgi:hypothetical protein